MEVPGVGRWRTCVSLLLPSGRKMKEGAAVGQSQQISVQDKPATQATRARFAPSPFFTSLAHLASLPDREDFLDADY